MPPTIYSLPDLPTLEEIKGGSVNGLVKKSLLRLALDLQIIQPDEINQKKSVTELKSAINEALKSPAFSSDVRFHKFTVHRPATTGGAAIKKSLDKAKDDAAAGKQDIAPTGAHQKLLNGENKSDPPASHRHLKTTQQDRKQGDEPSKKEKEGQEGDFGHASDSSPLSSGAEDDGIKPSSIPPAKPNVFRGEVSELPIKVNFHGIGTPSREVWILRSQRENISVVKDANGKHTTSLKKLVPAALTQFSPAKGEGEYRLRINGSTGNPYTLGTMHQFLSGQFDEVLELIEADTCRLDPDPSGVLVCDLILEARSSSNPAASAIQPHMKPLELAQTRGKSESKSRLKSRAKGGRKTKGKVPADSDDDEEWPDNPTDQPFLEFLCHELEGKEDGYPGLQNVGEMRGRYLTFTGAVKYLNENWKSTTRGIPWRVPSDYKDNDIAEVRQYANRPFNKADLELALDVAKTIASRDREVFEHPDLVYDPILKRWAAGDDEGIDSADKRRFAAMTRSKFFKHLEECKADKLAEDAERARGKGKRRREASDDDKSDAKAASSSASEMDSEAEKALFRALQKKMKARKAVKKDEKASRKDEKAGPSKRSRLNSETLDGED
ncbi:hypothetical protein DFH06DRAFT_480604 [Mycena polygramma]|nr:hypothetical protein DFH06DRAFT_480604 [Mycena polygramma]